jgi:multidrug resistance efflux pump
MHNGNALVTDELAERPTVTRSPEGDQSAVATLKARIETLEAELAKVEGVAAGHRADFERERERFDRERERCERLMAEGLKTTAELMAAREATARIAGELAAYQARPWWRRLVG